jgi:hypothetical protein
MNRFVRSRLGLILLASASSLLSLGAAPEPIKLTLSPSPAPVPAMAHRLLPLESELNPGDAAPIYLRLIYEQRDRLNDLYKKTPALLESPPDKFPLKEARTFVDGWGLQLTQLGYGTRRSTCDWNYTLPEQREHSIDLMLPDAQTMLTWSRLLALKARVEIIEGKPVEAARTVETGLALARHVAQGPFVINALVGIGASRVLLAQVDGLIALPDAPNFYWSLTALPRPLIGIRRGIEHDSKVTEWMLPELTDLDRSRTDAEWSALLDRLHGRIMKLKKSFKPEGVNPKLDTPAGFREVALPRARGTLETAGMKTDGMGDDRVIIMALAAEYHRRYDDLIKASYLSFHEAEPFYTRAWARLSEEKSGPFWIIPSMAVTVESFHQSDALLDRKVAALRVVEALRLHTGESGRLPDSLDEVKVVPIPIDPFSGKAFSYQLEGDTATLAGIVSEGRKAYGLTYKITLRK